MRGLRTTALAAVVASLVVTSLSWLGTLWRERGLGLQIAVSGSGDAGGPWTRSARVRSVRRDALDELELPSRANLHVTWSGVWQVPHSGPLVIRALGAGDVRVSLDGIAVLVLPRSRARRWHEVSLEPKPGFHDLEVEWFAPRATSQLKLQWAPSKAVFGDLDPETLMPARPSAVRLGLYRLVSVARGLVPLSWGLTMIVVLLLCARSDLPWGVARPGSASSRGDRSQADEAGSRPLLVRRLPWPLALPAAGLAVWLPGVLLVSHAAIWRADTDLRYLPASLRYWEELSIASTQYLEDGNPSRFEPASIASGSGYRVRLMSFVNNLVTRSSLRPWEFWRPLNQAPPFKRAPLYHRKIEDTGRSWLSRGGFHVVGGIAPFLPLWLGPLCAVPLLAWVAWEFLRVGRLTAGLAFGMLVASSPFVVELLTLYYSPAGFYVLGLLSVLALTIFVVLGPPPRLVSLFGRCLLFGVAFALCTVCRSGVGLFAPVAVVLLVVGVVRGWTAPRVRLGVAVLGLCLLFGPYSAVRPEQHHSVWMGVWEGLGDFDRTKGYVFSDRAAKARLIEAGATDIPRHRGLASTAKEDYSQESTFMRSEVLEDIRADPLWYLTILGKRLFFSLTQYKLMDRGRSGGSSFTPATSGNEGAIDVYYRFTKTADWVGLGPWLYELPVLLLWTPLLAWLGWQRRRLLSSSNPAWTLIAVGACALTVPMVITVAGAFETQSFVLVYYLGAALLCDSVVARVGRWRVSAGGSAP